MYGEQHGRGRQGWCLLMKSCAGGEMCARMHKPGPRESPLLAVPAPGGPEPWFWREPYIQVRAPPLTSSATSAPHAEAGL